MRAYVPQPTSSFLHILRTQESDVQDPALPPAWRPVQLALARVLSLSIEKGGKRCEPHKELVDGLPYRHNASLKKLLMVLYYHQVQELVGKMDNAGADTKSQIAILGELAEPLQRYSKYLSCPTLCIWILIAIPAEAVEAVGAHPFELDPVRRHLCNLFGLPSVNTGKTLFGESPIPHSLEFQSRNPLVVFLNYIRRIIRERELEASTYGAVDILARSVIAFAGGLILIAPLVIMTFLNTNIKGRLIVFCCFVGAFAALVGFFTRATNQEVLAATAIYTGVLALAV